MENLSTALILSALDDGEWHSELSLLSAMGHLIPPEKAARRFNSTEAARIKYSGKKTSIAKHDLDRKVSTGRQMIFSRHIDGAVRTGRMEVDRKGLLRNVRITEKGAAALDDMRSKNGAFNPLDDKTAIVALCK